MKIRYLVALFFLVVCLQAAPDLAQPIAELKLVDGRVLHDVQLKAYNNKGVMVRHAEGVAQVNYDQFPEEYRAAVLAKKPAPIEHSAVAALPPVPKPANATTQAGKSKQQIPGRKFGGAVYAVSSRKTYGLNNVDVRIYPLQYFLDLDQRRRSALTPAHVEMRNRLNGKGTSGMPSMQEIAQFYVDEYGSWDDLPPADFSTRTKEDGQFAMAIPAKGDYVVFARAKTDLNSSTQYFVWAVLADRESIELSHSNLYPMLKD